ncbi:MAG TPA: sialate O-acetylesterase [Pyrinomonadaceae bacterium]|nr:sialate O-acetylesterase [Pyrinomonadaceae bacterium]
MRKIFVLFLLMAFFGGVEPARAQESSAARPFLHPLFGDDMVLQRNVKFPVWGWTTPGASVTVQLRGQKAAATADADGKWLARLGPFEAGGPYTLTISGPQSVTLNNVLVGDVWLCSGQSNMEMGVTQVDNPKEEAARANYPRLRLFTVPKTIAATPQSTVQARWLVTTPANITTGGWGGFSAVAYFFGRHLHKELNVPIGLIHSSWGGTVAEGWVSAEALSAMEEFQPAIKSLAETMTAPKKAAVDVDRATEAWWPKNDPGSGASPAWSDAALDASQWKTMRLPQLWEDAGLPDYDGVVWFRRTFELPADWAGRDLVLSLGPIDDRDTTFVNGVRVGAMSQYDAPRSYKVPASALRPGVNTIAVRVLDTGVGGGIYGSPEQMKIVPAGGGAAVSLAGEWSYRPSVKLVEVKEAPPTQPASGNLGLVNARYNGMIAPLLPFSIKGAIWYQGESNVGRAAQYEKLLPVMIRDWRARFESGDFPFLIVQLANYLGRKTVPADSEWARLREAQLKVSQAVPHAGLAVAIDIGDAKDIHPKNKQEVGRRLALAALEIAYGKKGASSGPVYREMKEDGGVIRLSFDHADGGLVLKPGEGGLSGFAIAGEDRRFVWADAVVRGKEVWVSSPQVKFPIAVRYGWADNPVSTLYNAAGLPASPFRTDDFKAGGTGSAGN